MKSLFLWTLFYVLCFGQDSSMSMDDYDWYYEARAYFMRYAMGEVTIINGNIEIDLDVSKVKSLLGNISMGLPSNCFDDGVLFHIHDNWDQNTDMDYVGRQMCDDDDQTGDHFDPWFACSTKSGSGDCNYNGGCIRPSSFLSDTSGTKYRCNDSIYESYPYACEISDYTKYEVISIGSNSKIKKSYSSLWELNGMDIVDGEYNVVFHCNDDDKTPAFCAPLNVTNRTKTGSNSNSVASHDTGQSNVNVNFDGLKVGAVSFNDIEIIIGEGWIEYNLPHRIADNCTMWSAYIMSEWNHSSNDAMYDNMCDMMYVGGVYDPTYSCITDPYKESGNDYCSAGTRCPGETNTEVDYACDSWSNALKCAAGHLSGRTGYINMTMHAMENKNYAMTFSDRVSPPIESLIGKSVLLYCEDEGNNNNHYPQQICTPITSSNLNLSTAQQTGLTTGGVVAILLIIIFAIGIGSAYWYSRKNHQKSLKIKNKESTEKFAVIQDLSPVSRTDDVDVDVAGNHNLNINQPPHPPLATGDYDGGDKYVPPPNNTNNNNEYDEARAALPAQVSMDHNVEIGTMNEGNGYMMDENNNNNEQNNNFQIPPPVPKDVYNENNDNEENQDYDDEYEHVEVDDNE